MGRLSALGENIWLADGPVVPFLTFPYPTRMAVIRLANGDLFIWSPVRLDDELKAEVEALGRVAHLVSPNLIHHLYLSEWKAAFPQARLYASPGLPARRRDLAFDAVLGDRPEPAWAGQIEQVAFRGSVAMTEIVFVHLASRTAIFADLIENFSPSWFTGWRRWLARLDGIVHPDYGPPREFRFSFVRRTQARAALERVLACRPEKVIIAHGEIARADGVAFIGKAFAWLMRGRGTKSVYRPLHPC